jgi:hypothetical protein
MLASRGAPYLISLSKIIANLYDNPSPGVHVSVTIDTGCPEACIQAFANIVYNDEPNPYVGDTAASLMDMLDLCDRLMADHIGQLALRALHDMAKDRPWWVFVEACKREKLELARLAIRNFDATRGIELHTLIGGDVRGLPPAYLLQLMRLRIGNLHRSINDRGEVSHPAYRIFPWTEVSDKFTLIAESNRELDEDTETIAESTSECDDKTE